MSKWGKDVIKLFKEEAQDFLSSLESSLLELEKRPDDKELVMEVFRTFHTIKGNGAMCGFRKIADFTHEIETVFDMVRNGDFAVTKPLIDITLLARDFVVAELERETEDENGFDTDTAETIIKSFNNLIPQHGASQDSTPIPVTTEEDPLQSDRKEKKTYRIRFYPHQDIFMSGTNPVLLLKELRELGDCRFIAHTNAIPPLNEFDHELCYTHWDILLTTDSGINSIKDVFIFVGDQSRLSIDIIDDDCISADINYKRLGEILLDRKDISMEDLKKALESQKRVGDFLVEAGVVDQHQITSALAEQEQIREIRKNRRPVMSSSSIRVASEKLDSLVDLVGELVTIKARLSQTAATQKNTEVLVIAEAIERITENLRDNTLSLRMVPIGTTFNHFGRLVRELSLELGKKVDLSTEGEETELDKTVIEKLNEPLVHLIRNCIDHGIEPPDIRESAGKPRTGKVHLSSFHSGHNVLIRIQDDGIGLDPQAIKAHAVKKGIITEDSDLQVKDLYALIFSHGFSTSQNVTNVSGRGVGLDVVRKSLDALGGSVEIDSKKGAGTSFTLKLPLTLAIIEGLLVKVGEEYFVFPLLQVEECIELMNDDIEKKHGRQIINVRGKAVPYVRLRDRFGLPGQIPVIEQIVLTETAIGKVGIVVDQVIGGYQTVIKSLGRVYKNVNGISGATILGDGTVALILDIEKITVSVEKESEKIGSY